ncbi:hypothetical protein ACMFMG_000911 [Clarireedia jacksonii]
MYVYIFFRKNGWILYDDEDEDEDEMGWDEIGKERRKAPYPYPWWCSVTGINAAMGRMGDGGWMVLTSGPRRPPYDSRTCRSKILDPFPTLIDYIYKKET